MQTGHRPGNRAVLMIAAQLMAAALLFACGSEQQEVAAPEMPSVTAEEEAAVDPALAAIRERAQVLLGTLPSEVPNPANPVTPAKIELGRMLYYDERLSKNHDVSCNTCHLLDRFGVDGTATSTGHRGQQGDRNAPTVYNAALHIAQFWDGRAADVEEQAKGPVLNPVEMAMPSEAATVAVLASIPGYAPLFTAAFPEDEEPITYDNMARAIGAFERRLMTPAAYDAFLAGDDDALSDAQLAGLDVFLTSGCIVCHQGPALGGQLYQKLGLVKPYPTDDPGRAAVTGDEADRQFFKVPSLRNVVQTGPYLHDGSIERLEDVIHIMAVHQLGIELGEQKEAAIRTFLDALSGSADATLIARPELPPSGPNTPAPDPT